MYIYILLYYIILYLCLEKTYHILIRYHIQQFYCGPHQVESEAPSAPEIAPSPTESPSLTVPDTMPAAAQMELARKDTTQLEA